LFQFLPSRRKDVLPPFGALQKPPRVPSHFHPLQPPSTNSSFTVLLSSLNSLPRCEHLLSDVYMASFRPLSATPTELTSPYPLCCPSSLFVLASPLHHILSPLAAPLPPFFVYKLQHRRVALVLWWFFPPNLAVLPLPLPDSLLPLFTPGRCDSRSQVRSIQSYRPTLFSPRLMMLFRSNPSPPFPGCFYPIFCAPLAR